MVDGQKLDTGKTRMELLPGDALYAIAQVLTFGAKKYASRNWENGIAWGRVFGALMRHLWAWWQGQAPSNKSFLFGDLDGETGMSHLWHAGCCIVFLIAYEMRGMAGFDDRPKAAPVVLDIPEPVYKKAGAGTLDCREQMDPVPYDAKTRRTLNA